MSLGRWLARVWDRITIYLPVLLMGVLALGSYWLVRNAPSLGEIASEKPAEHEQDYFLRRFSVKSFDSEGRLKSEIYGTEARHYRDTDTLEIDQPRIRSYNQQGALTVATAQRAVSNADGSEVQLIGDAVVIREPAKDTKGQATPRLQIRSEFLQVFQSTEQVRTHKPVVLTRGRDEFAADSLQYDNLDRVLDMKGRVRGTLTPGSGS